MARRDLNKINHRFQNEKIKYENSLNKRSLLGIFLAEVVYSADPSRTGRLEVFVPALGGNRANTSSYITCRWSSPFAGSTDVEGIGEDIKDYVGTTKSYGMWMVPPDIGNLVLITFADANISQAFVVSCVFPDKLTHMVPGMASGTSYSDPSLLMPVAEKNRRDEKQTHNDASRPAHIDLAEAITLQGLLQDPLRGAGPSSSRREAPSEVFGILTPGPRDPKNFNHRMGGNQFIMDDSLDSSLIRLRTRRGVQILLDDTTGSIYMINRRGNAWFELAANGDINLFGEGSINMRAEGNMNIRADKNLNLEAGQNVYIKAAGDRSPKGDYAGLNPPIVGLPPKGVGGNIRFEATAELTAYAARNVQLTAFGGDIDLSAAGRISNSGGKFDVFTTGSSLANGMGISMITDGAFQTIAAKGATLSSPMPVSLVGSIVNLNSGVGPIPMPAIPAVPAPQIDGNTFKDAPGKPPEFKKPESDSDGDGASDLEGAVEVKVKNTMKRAKPLAPTAGERTGKQDSIKTILTAFLTKEPYSTHYLEDTLKSTEKDPSKTEVDPRIPGTGELGATTQKDGSSEIVTNYVGKDGETVVPSETVTTATGKAVSNATTLLNAAQAEGAADAMANGNPVFNKVLGILNNFTSMDATKLLEIVGLGSVIAGIKAAIPPIRFPTSNARMEKIIGLQKELSAMQAQLNAFGMDQFGFDLDILSAEMKNMKGIIDNAIATASDAQDLVNILKSKGIEMPVDGEMIFQDANGNKFVDFSGGIGPVGATLGLIGDMNKVYNTISSDIDVLIHDNGKLALTSFAQSIGVESFANSRLRDYVNDPSKHNLVGREMQKWVLDKPGGSIDPVLVGRRQYESQLFQSPDEMDLDFGDLPDGGMSWGDLAEMIKTQREEFYVKKTSIDGPPTAS